MGAHLREEADTFGVSQREAEFGQESTGPEKLPVSPLSPIVRVDSDSHSEPAARLCPASERAVFALGNG